MIDIVNDLSLITTIPKTTLDRLNQKEILCICESVQESRLANESVSSMDIGIGTLHIKWDEESIKYRFVPSKALEQGIISTVVDGKNPFESAIEDTIVTKIVNTYKELF